MKICVAMHAAGVLSSLACVVGAHHLSVLCVFVPWGSWRQRSPQRSGPGLLSPDERGANFRLIPTPPADNRFLQPVMYSSHSNFSCVHCAAPRQDTLVYQIS